MGWDAAPLAYACGLESPLPTTEQVIRPNHFISDCGLFQSRMRGTQEQETRRDLLVLLGFDRTGGDGEALAPPIRGQLEAAGVGSHRNVEDAGARLDAAPAGVPILLPDGRS